MATLDTALDKLSDLFSKDFVVNSVPVIAFLFLHGAVAYNVLPGAREFIATHFLSDQNVITALFTLLFTVVLTYVLAALNSPLRELLEGKHWPEWLANAFRQKYLTRLDRIEQKMDAATSARRELKDRRGGWVRRLSEAIELGKTKPSGDYSRSPMLDELARQVAWNKGVSYVQVQLAVTDLCRLLLANNTSLERAKKLVEDQERLVILIARAIDQWDAVRIQLQNQIRFEFAGRNVACRHADFPTASWPSTLGGRFVVRCALQFLALTVVRPGELRYAEWPEFSLDGKEPEWRIPAERMKLGDQLHIVPRSRQSVALLRELAPLTGGDGRGYVFPSNPQQRFSAHVGEHAERGAALDGFLARPAHRTRLSRLCIDDAERAGMA